MNSSEQNPKRRRLRVSLRTFLILLTVGCVWLGWLVNRANQQRQVVEWVTELGGGVHYDYEIDARVVAGYVHSEWPVTDRVRLVAGARVEQTVYEYNNLTATNTVGRFQRPADRNDTYTTFNPRLGLVVDLSEQWTGFANYARGSRAPQTADLYRRLS